jgi:hypothetical protein
MQIKSDSGLALEVVNVIPTPHVNERMLLVSANSKWPNHRFNLLNRNPPGVRGLAPNMSGERKFKCKYLQCCKETR